MSLRKFGENFANALGNEAAAVGNLKENVVTSVDNYLESETETFRTNTSIQESTIKDRIKTISENCDTAISNIESFGDEAKGKIGGFIEDIKSHGEERATEIAEDLDALTTTFNSEIENYGQEGDFYAAWESIDS